MMQAAQGRSPIAKLPELVGRGALLKGGLPNGHAARRKQSERFYTDGRLGLRE
jgi:hypothetical protein